ncbi:MAG: hypothetical protein ABEI52_12650 [Halobacteriaceae archaeon]
MVTATSTGGSVFFKDGYTVHQFTEPGSHVLRVSNVGPQDTMDILVVGGGGGGDADRLEQLVCGYDAGPAQRQGQSVDLDAIFHPHALPRFQTERQVRLASQMARSNHAG